MKKYSNLLSHLFFLSLLMAACNNEDSSEEPIEKKPGIKTETVSYGSDTAMMNGFVAYDSGSTDKRPVVMIVHEWWGLTDYVKQRARQLAELGYVAFAVDMYGNGKTVDNPTDANAASSPFYSNSELVKQRFDAAMAKVATIEQADQEKIAAIGYCFGGAMVLNVARMGEDLDGVVSFHGNLFLGPNDKSLLKSSILVCHGAADPFVPKAEVDQFRKSMDSLNADYTFKAYEGATHAFTNPGATEKGEKFGIPIAYNAAADSASWNDMKVFLEKVFK